MSDTALNVESISKKFRRGANVDTLRDLIGSRLWGRRRAESHEKGILRESEFWAVRDVSFTVAPGESFGIIGPNGAGKSTILKMLAGIMRADEGRLSVRGPVAPLIELGAGFHPDLSGRENIYLNASILGISRKRLKAKIEQIVEFAGIGDFVDTPVKRYSSGMYTRLGFAIAVHVEPRVMLVDEVLSVGDRVFRAKCMDKMREFLADGVSVVFVSHDLASVQRFCDRAMVVCEGRTSFCGPSSHAVGHYWQHSALPRGSSQAGHPATVKVSNVTVLDANGHSIATAPCGDRIRFEFDIRFEQAMQAPSFGASLVRSCDQLLVFETSSTRLAAPCEPVLAGQVRHVRYDLQMNVAPGVYNLGLHVRERDGMDYAIGQECAAQIIVDGSSSAGGIAHVDPHVEIGIVPPALTSQTSRLQCAGPV